MLEDIEDGKDEVDIRDRNYDRKYQDIPDRIDKLYDDMSKIEDGGLLSDQRCRGR